MDTMAWLEQHKDTYTRSPETKRALASRVLVMLVGPSAVGKSSIIEEVLRVNVHQQPPLWETGGSLTTRARRADDPAQYRTADEGVTLETFQELFAKGELTNISLVPPHAYGSTPESFPARYNLLPTLTDSIAELEQAGFERTESVYILCEPDALRTRLTERAGDQRYLSRIHEMHLSLQYAHDHIDELHFVDNSDGQLSHAAANIAQIALTSQPITKLEKAAVHERIQAMRTVAYDIEREIHAT